MKWFQKSIVNRFLILFMLGVMIPTTLLSVVSYSITYDVIYDMSAKSIKDELDITTAKIDEIYRSVNTVSARITIDADVHKIMRATYDRIYDWYMVMTHKLYDMVSVNCASASIPLSCMVYGENDRFYCYASTREERIAFQTQLGPDSKINEMQLAFYPTTDEMEARRHSVMLAKVMRDMALVPSGRIGFMLEDETILSCIPQDLRKSDHQFYLLDQNGDIILTDSQLGVEKDLLLIKGDSDVVLIDGMRYIVCLKELSMGGANVALARPMQDVMARLYPWQKMMVFSGILVIALGLILGIQVFHMIGTPMRRLDKEVRRVAVGDFKVRFPENGSDEVARLGHCLNEMCAQLEQLIEERVQQEREKTHFEAISRQTQINTHFLINTLNDVRFRSMREGKNDIAEMLESLGMILNAALRTEKLISLKDELKLLECYIRIVRWRYEEKVGVFVRVNADIDNVQVPVLVFQPLVENAVLHGMSDDNPLMIIVEIYEDDKDRIILSVRDNGVGMTAEKVEKIFEASGSTSHIGLANLNRRWQIAFGESYAIQVDTQPNMGCCIRMILPKSRKD